MRSLYTKAINPRTGVHFTPNEADYWGTISEIDAAVGRVRGLLSKHNVADNTWVSITADNGPEVNPAGGQSTGNYENPGLTGGLRGRKRDATEGGTREIGLVEYPPAVKVTTHKDPSRCVWIPEVNPCCLCVSARPPSRPTASRSASRSSRWI